MNILDTLKRLRDDIKTWVANNLNDLNKRLTKSIDNIPKFSGDYNDLTNAPDISEDGSGNMVITDESGNIIFKADAEGIHTTAVSLNGEAAATEKYVDEAVANIEIPKVDFTGYATEDFVTSAVDSAKEELSESITSETEELKVVDEVGNIIFSVDADGAHTTELTLSGEKAATEKYVDDAISAIPSTDLTDYYNKEETNAAINTAKEEISESIVSESNEWKIVDEAGNIIFSVDETGAHTTELTLNGETVANIVETKVASLVDSAPDTLNTLNELAAALGDDPNFATTVATEIGKKVDKVSGKDLSTNDFTNDYKNILDNLGSMAFEETDPTVPEWAKTPEKPTYTKAEIGLENVDNTSDINKPISTATQTALNDLKEELSESITSESDSWTVVDEAGNVIFSVDDEGAHTTNLSLNGEVVATEKYVNDIIAENKSYNVGPIEDKALWLRVAKLNLTSMGSASGTFIINYKTTFADLETAETKTYFLGSAKFDLGASTTVLGGKQRYSLEVTPIFSSLIPVKWASNGTNTPDELEDEFDYEMLLTSVGSGSGLTVYGISHVRLIADPDDVDEVYLEIFFNNSTLRDEKIFEIELSNNKNIVLLDEITQGSIFTDVFEHRIALNDGDTFYKNSATLTHSRIDGLVVDTNTMILFKDSTNNYYRFGWVDNSFVKESMYPASGGGMASGEILETYRYDSLEDGKYII